ncbi:MAG: hypothetical protein H6918_07790 [Sphingomonadaceae bacterium]|nr:hypothetical protein [Sphingomonadaceae bacterium]
MRESRLWPYFWLFNYCASHFAVLAMLLIPLIDCEALYLASSLAFPACLVLLARRASDQRIASKWWVGLIGFQAASLAFFNVLAFAGPGDAQLCESSFVHRFRQTIPDGVSPSCWENYPDSLRRIEQPQS